MKKKEFYEEDFLPTKKGRGDAFSDLEGHEDPFLFPEVKAPSKNQIKEYTLVFLKLLIGICFWPTVFGVTVCFSDQMLKVGDAGRYAFIWGVITFLVVHLFVWEPAILYKKGQRILEILFRFFAPLVKTAPYVLPIYGILIFLAYLIAIPFGWYKTFIEEFIFGFGFSFALHLVFCAKTLKAKSGDKLKANYIFGLSLIYILDALLLAFFFNIIFEDFSFLAFINGTFQISRDCYYAVFKQLFL